MTELQRWRDRENEIPSAEELEVDYNLDTSKMPTLNTSASHSPALYYEKEGYVFIMQDGNSVMLDKKDLARGAKYFGG